jgi:hypothetical protein
MHEDIESLGEGFALIGMIISFIYVINGVKKANPEYTLYGAIAFIIFLNILASFLEK